MADLNINGYIVGDDDARFYRWAGFNVACPGDLRGALAALGDNEPLTIHINSGGGSVFAGFEMYTLLRNSGKLTVAEVESIAASAASTVMAGCRTVRMSPVAQVMIHNPSTWTEGDAHAHKASLNALASIKEAIINSYELRVRGKCSRLQLSHMMDNETWLTAEQALEYGFADEIMDFGEAEPSNSFVNALPGLPDIATVRAQYEAAHAENAEDPAPSFDWDDAARRLEIENLRFGGM